MSPFNLFKRKAAPSAVDTSKDAGVRSGQESLPESSTLQQDANALAGQEFGLMFTFENGESRTFSSLPILIGRGEQSTLVLDDPSVSAKHAYVDYDGRLQSVCISDLDSTNGLYINDQPTRKNILQDDTRIRLGSVSLTFRDTGYIPR